MSTRGHASAMAGTTLAEAMRMATTVIMTVTAITATMAVTSLAAITAEIDRVQRLAPA